MSEAQISACQDMAIRLIADRKLEIQENAARTLAGMLKPLSPEAFDALKSNLLEQLNKQAPRRANKKEAGKHA